MRSILDPAFRYVPSFATSVEATWRRFGWRPTSDEDRKARRRPVTQLVVDWVGAANARNQSAHQLLSYGPDDEREERQGRHITALSHAA